MSLDAATLALVAGELKNTLLDAKIDKIFEPTRDEVLMTLRTRTETHRLLLSARSGSARGSLSCAASRGTASSILTSAARTRWAIWSRTRWPSS